MARKKEKKNSQHVTADHWALILVTIHPFDKQLHGKYGLYLSKQAKAAGARPIETVEIRIKDSAVLVSPEMEALLDAAISAEGAPLAASTHTPD